MKKCLKMATEKVSVYDPKINSLVEFNISLVDVTTNNSYIIKKNYSIFFLTFASFMKLI